MNQAAARLSPFELARLRCEFCDGATERAFLEHHLPAIQAQLRVTFLFCTLFYVGFGLTDYAWLGYGEHLSALLAARLGVALAAMAGLLLTRWQARSIRVARLVASVVEIAGCAGFLLVAALRSDQFSLHAISMSVVVLVLYIYVPNRLLYASAIALSATAGFVLLAWQLGRQPSLELTTMALTLLLSNLFGYVAARRYQLLWREEYSAQTVLKNLSIRDPLTGCYNRRHLHEQLLENEVARAQRYSQSLTVIMCDLDHFKAVNDTYGHYGGDAVLQLFAGLLQAMTRDGVDSVVRYGGEEFLLILPATDLNGGVLLAERLRLAFADTVIHHDEHQISATASFGVASIDFAGGTDTAAHHGMIASADHLLYAAKSGGRNQVCARQLP